MEIIEAADLTRHFSTIVASGDTPESKPSPAPYQLAFTLIQQAAGRSLDPSRCVAIEDSAWGLESARGAGLRCVGVTTSYAADQLRGAELIVEGLRALTIPALEQLCGTNLSAR
jgi:beta-phosphoglucomutase-like phosphatase (HAD superfamily)